METDAPTSAAPAATSGLVFNIMRFALHDGPGIRTTIFLKGCPLRCWWCHNPESESQEPDILYFEERCIRCAECVRACSRGALSLVEGGGRVERDSSRCDACGECAEACPTGARQLVGRRMTVAEVVREVAKDQVCFDQSGGGATISGGEPLLQPVFVEELLVALRARRIRTALDTCGLAQPQVVERIRPYVDLFLYDLKAIDQATHLKYTGAKNELILRNLASLAEAGSAVLVRMPVIPGVNDGGDQLDALAAFMTEHGLRDLDLLPYHRIGSDKYRRLHLDWGMDGIEPPNAEHMDRVVERLARAGLRVRIAG